MKGVVVRLAAALGLLLAPTVSALRPDLRLKPSGVTTKPHSNPEILGNSTFDQLLDHSDPSKGTFSQRYWWDDQYWGGPGSPVFLFNPGEDAADDYTGYLENDTIPGLYAQKFNGAVILVEHRYWGESIPFSSLTAETLQYLTLPNNVADMTYFAKNVKLDFDTSDGGANAGSSPWVLVGGSYSGALSAWTQVLDPGTFWAHHASSAVVEAMYDMYGYYDAVTAAIPANCSNDVKAVVAYVDWVFENGTSQDRTDLQTLFGLQSLSHPDDFAANIAQPLANWQEDQASVFAFCDYIETNASTGNVAAAHSGGVGLDAALSAYAQYVNASSGCSEQDCSSYDNSTQYNTPDVLDGDRQWMWMLCNDPFAWWQVGPPHADGKHVVSAQLQPEYYQRQCNLTFPPTNGFVAGSVMGFTTEHFNLYTGGWDADFQRVLFVQGQYDPWLVVTVSSPYRPGGPREASADMPIVVIEGGNHVPDLYFGDLANASAPVQAAVQAEVQVMGDWLGLWSSRRV